MRIAAIVLAAGASTRLGRPKQLLVLNDETMLDRAIRIAAEVCNHVIVVLGSQAELVRRGCDLREVTVIVNGDWPEGMGSSIRAGMKALHDFGGVLLTTCDMPAVTVNHLQRLIEVGSLSASSYSGKRGVPAYFPALFFPELLLLQGERGAQSLLQEARTVELAFGEMDVDTIDDFERAKASLLSGIH
jgi:molybdenum cofactor cytidylyltransferase